MIYDAWHMPTQRALMVCAVETDSLRLEDSLARMDPHSFDDCSNRSDSIYSTTGVQNLPQNRWIGVAATAGRSDRDVVEEIRDCANELGCKFGFAGPYCASKNPDQVTKKLGDPLDNRLNVVLDGPNRFWLGIQTNFSECSTQKECRIQVVTKRFDTLEKTWSKQAPLVHIQDWWAKSLRIYDLGRGIWALHAPFFDLRREVTKIRWVGDPLRINLLYVFDGKTGRFTSAPLLLPKGDGQPLFYDRDGDGFHEVGIFLEPWQTAEMKRNSFFETIWKDSLFVPYRSSEP
ncbi:MAG: hypothetical protein IPK50_02830 [Fibrobacterota bacterium]|nr:MAG: hypothetical protein IPK50_02830 [Fibrobacterota bacterium]